MVSPARQLEASIIIEDEEQEVFIGELRKYGVDKTTPWWERWFFRLIFLPFVRFAFKRMHIPAHGSVDTDGPPQCPDCALPLEGHRFSWVETIIVTTDKHLADSASKDEFYCVRPYQRDDQLPEESLQHRGHVYPASIMPDRYRRRSYPITSIPVVYERQIAQLVERVDQMRLKVKASTTMI